MSDDGPLISDLTDDPDMGELVEMFVADLQERIAQLETAHAGHDVEMLATLAHQLKGSAGGYGFTPITDAAAVLEKTLKTVDTDNEWSAVTESWQALVNLCRRASLSTQE